MCTKHFAYTNKFYVCEIAAVNLSKIHFLKNAKKTCKLNNRNLNHDRMIIIIITTAMIIIRPGNTGYLRETRKYWVDVQRGIVSSHGERDPL